MAYGITCRYAARDDCHYWRCCRRRCFLIDTVYIAAKVCQAAADARTRYSADIDFGADGRGRQLPPVLLAIARFIVPPRRASSGFSGGLRYSGSRSPPASTPGVIGRVDSPRQSVAPPIHARMPLAQGAAQSPTISPRVAAR